jgi:hypothetical protein
MPGLAVLFWLSEQLLSVRRVSRTLSSNSLQATRFFPPSTRFCKLSHTLIGGSFDEKDHRLGTV